MKFLMKKEQAVKSAERLEIVAQRIAGFILATQLRVSQFLGSRTRNFTKRQKKLVLALHCLTLGGLSSLVLILTRFENVTVTHATRIDRLAVPKYYDYRHFKERNNLIRSREIRSIHLLKQRLDSLQMTTNGRALYDSVLHGATALIDSLEIIEKYYLKSK